MIKGGATYILASPNKGTLYVGVTANLEARVWEHKNKVYPQSFSSRYNCVVLVYYKYFGSIEEAIQEEKRIKAGSRKKKEILISTFNPQWIDLYEHL